MPVTSTCTASGCAGSKRSDAQIDLLIKFMPTKRTRVSTVQRISSVLLPWE